MPVYSMTGFAAAACEAPAAPGASPATVSAELRSVNGRFLDLSLRLPDEWRALEPALRERVGEAIRRGKVELRLSLQQGGAEGLAQPSPEQLNRLARLEAHVQAWLPQAQSLSVAEVLQACRGSSVPAGLAETALEATPCLQANPEHQCHMNELMRLLQTELDGLMPEMREVLLLVAMDDMSYEDAAALLSVPIGTVRSRVSRARAHLRTRLQARGAQLPF